jgi:hypothetical protein
MFVVSSCSTSTEKTTEKSAAADTTKTNLVYTVKKPDNWDIGSTKNVAVAFNALKAFEDHKIDESLHYFGDSVLWKSDYIEAKISNDSLRSIFNYLWSTAAFVKLICTISNL